MQSQKVSSNWAENANLAILQSAGHRASVLSTQHLNEGKTVFKVSIFQAEQLAWYCTAFTDDVDCFVDVIVSQIDMNTIWTFSNII